MLDRPYQIAINLVLTILTTCLFSRVGELPLIRHLLFSALFSKQAPD
jgi:hypothetical protein